MIDWKLPIYVVFSLWRSRYKPSNNCLVHYAVRSVFNKEFCFFIELPLKMNISLSKPKSYKKCFS